MSRPVVRFLAALGAAAVFTCLAACYEDDGGARARAAEMKTLAGQSFIQDGGRCDDPEDCARDEAGFA